MTATKPDISDARTQAAIAELQALIRQHYPEATFRITRGIDDPEAIHLETTIDVADRTDVIELTLDHVMEIQIEDEIPIFVIPLRTPARRQALLDATTAAANLGSDEP
jgi:hypothetical protein